ncbi:MAG: hypothetical protein KAT58_09210, partial [candidate division Zixibacteria bacterium]|nr:hypothetical protein [candidate division Zixibacteria bacterium]
IGSKVGRAPYHFSALAGSLPLMNLKLMNVFVGIIAVFFASDWLKRDYRHDSTAVVHVRSIPNAHYVLGKVGGTVVVFLALILAVAVIGFIFHAFLSYTPFSWQPYLYYILLVNLPTLVFMIGVTLILMTLLRSQALVFILMLGYALLTLIFLKSHLFALFDVFAFFQPLFYSDFIGFSNLGELLRVRGMYFCAGIGAIGATTLLFRRLSQSRPANILMATVAIVSLSASLILGFSHLESGLAAGEYRQTLKSLSHNVAELPKAKVTDCSLDLEFKEDHLNCMADLRIVNQNSLSLDSLLFSINPGLKVTSVTSGNSEIDYRQVEHLLWIKPHRPLLPDSMMTLAITYAGTINQRYCYLDIAEERLEKTYRLFLYSIPKVYTVLGSDYLLLTAESGFYPMAGLSPGVAFPRQTSRHFVNFSLTVPTASDLKALSQGICHVDTTAAGLKYTFTSEQPLPQLSLVVGEYEERSITVDSITYSLYHRPGHAYYESYFEETGDTLTGLIRELKDDYEMQLGLEYPYLRLALVETPIQFYSYKRLWSLAQEMVQPEIVFIPELGAIGDATDFRRLQRIARRRQERANQEDSPQELAAQHFTTFVKTDLLGSSSFRLNIRSRDRIDPLSYIIPNYTSFVMQITSDRWPVLNYALESYIFSKAAAPQQTGGRR